VKERLDRSKIDNTRFKISTKERSKSNFVKSLKKNIVIGTCNENKERNNINWENRQKDVVEIEKE